MPVVPEPAVELMPRIEMSWRVRVEGDARRELRQVGEGFLTFSLSILAAVKALTLSGTLLRFSSLRVAVTITSPTSVAVAALAVEAAVLSAALAVDQRNGAATAAIRHALNPTAALVMRWNP